MIRKQQNAERSQDNDGWGPMRRMLQICAGLITAYAFYHGASYPQHVLDVQDYPSIVMRILAGIVIAFIPLMIFGLTFVRSYK